MPENWNGTLVVHAHGYRDLADHPGEVDDRSAPASPNAALEPALLAQGYALAGSAYKSNGWAVDEGIEDTRALVWRFRSEVAKPKRTLLWGFSMGSLVALSLAEGNSGLFDGYLAACAVAAGAPRAWDGAVATSLAYKVAFGWNDSWGTVGNVRDDVDFDTEVVPKMIGEVSNPANFGKFEFIRLVTGAAPSGFPSPSYPSWILTNMFFGLEARAELERRAGGPVGQNETHLYALSPVDKAYLAVLGVNPDVLLAQMNAQRTIAADRVGPEVRAPLRRPRREAEGAGADAAHADRLARAAVARVGVRGDGRRRRPLGAARADVHERERPLQLHRAAAPDRARCARQLGRDRHEADGGDVPRRARIPARLRRAGLAAAVRRRFTDRRPQS